MESKDNNKLMLGAITLICVIALCSNVYLGYKNKQLQEKLLVLETKYNVLISVIVSFIEELN